MRAWIPTPPTRYTRLSAACSSPAANWPNGRRGSSSHLPGRLDSLIDVGCAQGFFVLHAALRPERPRALGIDIIRKYPDAGRRTAACLGLDNARFECALPHEIAARLDDFGGPFQVVLLVNTYHYLFGGSDLHPFGYRDHGEVFRYLAALCAERLVFCSPLDHKSVPDYVRRRFSPDTYNREAILAAAREFFAIEHAGRLDRRPLLIMRRKSQGGGH